MVTWFQNLESPKKNYQTILVLFKRAGCLVQVDRVVNILQRYTSASYIIVIVHPDFDNTQTATCNTTPNQPINTSSKTAAAKQHRSRRENRRV